MLGSNRRRPLSLDALESRELLSVTPVLVKDMYVGSDSSPGSFARLGDQLYFAATSNNGRELWTSDGTSDGTMPFADLYPGSTFLTPNSSNPSGLTVVNGRMFFTATNGTTGTELWQSDGTVAGTTQVRDIRLGSNSSSPSMLTAVGQSLYFVATDAATGTELWQSDGTSAGTSIVYDRVVGSGSSDFAWLRAAGNRLLFSARTGFPEYGVYITHPDGSSPTLIRKDAGYHTTPATIGSKLFYASRDAVLNVARLWMIDTAAATPTAVLLRSFTTSYEIDHLTTVGDQVFFSATTSAEGTELWVTDGTVAGTRLVKDISQDTPTNIVGSYPIGLTAVGNQLYFSAHTLAYGRELWESDGTGAGTKMVADIQLGDASSRPTELTHVAGRLLFTTTDRDGIVTGGYQYEPTTDSLTVIPNLSFTARYAVSAPRIAVDNTIYYRGSNLSAGEELFKLTLADLPPDPSALTITNSNDDGFGSLRYAIQTANNLGGGEIVFQLSAQDPAFQDIDSALAGGDPEPDAWVIRPLSPLPVLAGGVRIAGLSQMSGPLGDTNPFGPEMILVGSNAGASANGLVLQGDNNSVEGIAINQFGGHGILVDGGASHHIAGNFIGTDATGRTAQTNGGHGIFLHNGAHWSLIENNVLSANAGAGMAIAGANTDGNIVSANRIGTTADGMQAIGNGGPGVQIDGTAKWNVIGGSSPTDRNVISGSLSHGVYIAGVGTQGNRIEGNYIGLNVAGTAALANGGDGVHVRDGATSNIIGGSEPGTGNHIAGNVESGVAIDGGDIISTLIAGNVIGLSASGDALSNNQFGIHLRNGAHWNVVENNSVSGNRLGGILLAGIGTDGNIIKSNRLGTLADGRTARGNLGPGLFVEGGAKWNLAENNIISGGLSHGVYIVGTGTNGNRIERNRIGVSASDEPLPNAGSGILIQQGAANNTIGATGAGNTIAHNLGHGIELYGMVEASSPVVGNTITANGGAAAQLGIDAPTELLPYFTEMTDAIRTNNTISGELKLVALPLVGDPPPANAKDDPRPMIRSLVPAYFPVPGGRADWFRLIEQNRPGEAEVILVVNVGVGAGGADGGPRIPDGWDVAMEKQFYREVLVAAYRRGIKLMGYVSTDYGQRSLELIKQDIADWKAMWPGITGIFLDEQIAGSSENPSAARTGLAYYQTIRGEVIKHFGPTNTPESDPRVVTNPGTYGIAPDDMRAYLDSVADIILTHEETRLTGFSQPTWATDYSPNRFSILLHQQASLPTAETLNSLYVGNVFFTPDGADGNPWDTAPSYWTEEVELIRQANARPLARGDDFVVQRNSSLVVGTGGLLSNDRIPAGSNPQVELVDGPTRGTLLLSASGTFIYTPTRNFLGTDRFTYRLNSNVGPSNVATINITVGDIRFAFTVPSQTTAGQAVTVTVRALDHTGKVASSYSGLAQVTSSDPTASLPPSVKLSNGVGKLNVVFTKAGRLTLRVVPLANSPIREATATVTVVPSAAVRYSLNVPTTAMAGQILSAIVTAYDVHGNIATNYTGVVRITTTDTTAGLPANARLRNGVGTFRITLKKAGPHTITATDLVNSALTLTSESVVVSPNSATRLSVVSPTNTIAGNVFNIGVTALDAYGNIATGYTGSLRLTSTDPTAVLPPVAPLVNGVGTLSVTLKRAGNRRITMMDSTRSSLTASVNVVVVAANATTFTIATPTRVRAGASLTATVTALDAFGNIATNYTGAVRLTSTDPVADLPAANTLLQGVRSFVVKLKTKGNQTITATDISFPDLLGTSATIVVV